MHHRRAFAVSFTLLTGSYAAAQDDDFKTNQYKYCLDGIESRLPEKNAENLLFWKKNCSEQYDALGDGLRGKPAVVEQKKRFDALMVKVDAITAAQAKLDEAKNAGNDAVSEATFGDMSLPTITSGQTESVGQKVKILSKGANHFKTCLEKIEIAVKQNPNYLKEDANDARGSTGEQLRQRCKDGLAKAEKGVEQFQKAYLEEGKKKAKDAYTLEYVKLLAAENVPDELSKSKDPLTALDVYSAFHYLADDGRLLDNRLAELLEEYDFLATHEVAKGVTVSQMKEKTAVWRKRGEEGTAAWADRNSKAFDLYKPELLKTLSGDKQRIVKQQGLPSWTDQMTVRTTARAGLKLYSKAKWFRYDGNGCQTYYHFSGAKLTNTKKEGVGCR